MITIANDVLSLSVHSSRGCTVASFKVLGIETLDTHDLGRGIHAALYFPAGPAGASVCDGVVDSWICLQSAGNDEGTAARLFRGPERRDRTLTVGAYPQMSPAGGELWQGTDDYFRILAEYTVGPTELAPFNEVAALTYRFCSSRTLEFMHTVCDEENCTTPVPYIPTVFFKSAVLNRLFGLHPVSGQWREHIPRTGARYHPSTYREKAMAWMRDDLSWGVALYGAWTLCESESVNFVAQGFPDYRVNSLSLVDQSLDKIHSCLSFPDTSLLTRTAWLIAGNLDTVKGIADFIHARSP